MKEKAKTAKGIVIFLITFFLFGVGCAQLQTRSFVDAKKGIPSRTPSILDKPEQGLYFGFIHNDSSHYVEYEVWSVDREVLYFTGTLQPCPRDFLPSEMGFRDFSEGTSMEYSHCVHKLLLPLEKYQLNLINRDDILGGFKGSWKFFITVLDEEYVKTAPGPFIWAVEDDQEEEPRSFAKEYDLRNHECHGCEECSGECKKQ